jgi:hypothetical protein
VVITAYLEKMAGTIGKRGGGVKPFALLEGKAAPNRA